jgi:PAS domain S-box-containing protein
MATDFTPTTTDTGQVALRLDLRLVTVGAALGLFLILLATASLIFHLLFSVASLAGDAMLATWRLEIAIIGVVGVISLLAVGLLGGLILKHVVARQSPNTRTKMDHESEARLQLKEAMTRAQDCALEAKEGEARLRRTEELLNRTQELGSIGIYERQFDSEIGTWSGQTYRIFGVTPDEFRPTHDHFMAMVHPDDHELVNQSHIRVAAGSNGETSEYRIIRPDGMTRTIRRISASTRDEKGAVTGFIATLQDITEQRQSEERLRLLQNLSVAIAEADGFEAALAIVVRSACTVIDSAYGETWIPNESGTELMPGPFWHDGAPALAKYAEERQVSPLKPGSGHVSKVWESRVPEWISDLTTNPSREPTLRAFGAGLKAVYIVPICSGTEVLAIVRFAMLSTSKWDDSTSDTVSAVVAQLGTALWQKRTEQALRESEQVARGIIATALDAFIQIDNLGNVIEWNPRAANLFGWTRHEAMRQPLSTLIVPALSQTAHNADLFGFLKTQESGTLGSRFEMRAVRRDGTEIQIELAVTAQRQRGAYVYNVFIRDLTEKLAVEQQLRQAQKMEAVGNLTGGLAHDFNNLLGVIMGNLELLREMVPDDPEVNEVSGDALEAARRGADLTRRLLAFARRQPLRPQHTDVNTLVSRTAKLLTRTLGEQIEFKLTLATDLWSTLIDPAQLEAAITNLATNARDAMPKGGKLAVRTCNAHLDGDYATANWDVVQGDYVMLEVTDSGSGMPLHIVSQIFEPFFTTKEEGKGSGLGLSMVFGFIKQSGGHVTVYSEPGLGSCFRLYLPRNDRSPPMQDEMVVARPAVGGTEIILVVEDNEGMRAVVFKQLNSLGYRVLQAENASAAFDLLAEDRSIDLLFTDIVMPGAMDGSELAREATLRRPNLKVLLSSGFPETRIAALSGSVPVRRLLNKPYSKEELARAVREVLDEATPPRS